MAVRPGVSVGLCCRVVPFFVGYCLNLHKEKKLFLYVFVKMGFANFVVVASVFTAGWVTSEGHRILGVFYRQLQSKSLTLCLISLRTRWMFYELGKTTKTSAVNCPQYVSFSNVECNRRYKSHIQEECILS